VVVDRDTKANNRCGRWSVVGGRWSRRSRCRDLPSGPGSDPTAGSSGISNLTVNGVRKAIATLLQVDATILDAFRLVPPVSCSSWSVTFAPQKARSGAGLRRPSVDQPATEVSRRRHPKPARPRFPGTSDRRRELHPGASRNTCSCPCWTLPRTAPRPRCRPCPPSHRSPKCPRPTTCAELGRPRDWPSRPSSSPALPTPVPWSRAPRQKHQMRRTR